MSRVRRRGRFATPFVLVVGCWSERSTTTPVTPPPHAVTTDAAELAVTPPPPDATVAAVATIDAAPGRCDLDPTARFCNPPPPRTIELNARVMSYIGVSKYGLEFEVKLLGGDVKFNKMRGEFLDGNSNKIEGTEFKVLKVTKDLARCLLPGSATSLPSQRVRLYGELRDEP